MIFSRPATTLYLYVNKGLEKFLSTKGVVFVKKMANNNIMVDMNSLSGVFNLIILTVEKLYQK
jgi:hypothetical protein